MQGRLVDTNAIRSAFPTVARPTLLCLLECHRILNECLPIHEQRIRWNSIAYMKLHPRKMAHDCICSLSPRGRTIELGFYLGSLLEDPASLLKGTTKYKRFVPIQDTDHFKDPLIMKLLDQSIALVEKGWKHTQPFHSSEYLELIRGI